MNANPEKNDRIKDGVSSAPEMDCFLMIGQSNMAGRGDFGVVPPIENKNIFMLRNGRWQIMSEPINPDRGIFSGKYRSGVGLAASFALRYHEETGRRVGLIPCADGGTSLAQWQPGEVLFENAVNNTRFALRNSTLKGVLWHQGEADVPHPELVATYGERFIFMIGSLFSTLGVAPVPVVIGELGEYLLRRKNFGLTTELNRVFHSVAEKNALIGVASAEGLNCREDILHFDSPSLRIFGERYYDVYRELSARVN